MVALNDDPKYCSGPVLLEGSVVEFCSRLSSLALARVVILRPAAAAAVGTHGLGSFSSHTAI